MTRGEQSRRRPEGITPLGRVPLPMNGGDSAGTWLTGAADDQQGRTLAVLLLDETGCDGAPLGFH